ncbi:MAG: hypothetical protein ABI208_01830 [Ginsengibacter sp.]|jgi:hypothetical protein
MIKFSDLKQGDYVLATNDGQSWRGEVKDFNNDEKQICINNGTQDFWFKSENLFPIILDDTSLLKLNFKKVVNEDSTVKYMKDAFRILIPKAEDFSRFEIWYRDEKRQIMEPIFLHQLQNHYLDMTKVYLTDSSE